MIQKSRSRGTMQGDLWFVLLTVAAFFVLAMTIRGVEKL